MSTYATQQDLLDRFGDAEVLRYTDRDHDGVADAGYLAQLISDAAAEIDGYLSARYPLPLPGPEPLLTKIACDLVRAAYHGGGDEDKKAVAQAADTARRLLRDLAAGDAALSPAAAPGAVTTQSAAPLAAGPAPVFTPQSLAGWLP